MSVVIRLMRAGAKKRPFYRLVAADSRRQRDGRFIEILGHYNPMSEPAQLVVQKEKVEHWVGQGARPSEQVASLLRSVGIAVGGAPSRSRKKAAAGTAGAAARKGAKRRVRRTVSERKTHAKVARKKRVAAGIRTAKKPAPKA